MESGIVAIDPGRRSGIAAFYEGELVYSDSFKHKISTHSPELKLIALKHAQRAIFSASHNTENEATPISMVIEGQFWAPKMNAAGISVAWCAGSWACCGELLGMAVMDVIYPATWRSKFKIKKGSSKSDVHQAVAPIYGMKTKPDADRDAAVAIGMTAYLRNENWDGDYLTYERRNSDGERVT